MKQRERRSVSAGCVAVDMPSRLRSTSFILPEIHPNHVWSVEVLADSRVKLAMKQFSRNLFRHSIQSRHNAGIFGQHVRIVKDGRVHIIPLIRVVLKAPILGIRSEAAPRPATRCGHCDLCVIPPAGHQAF